jgi:hypothetical protein
MLSSKKDIDDHIFSGQFQVNFQVISVTRECVHFVSTLQRSKYKFLLEFINNS